MSRLGLCQFGLLAFMVTNCGPEGSEAAPTQTIDIAAEIAKIDFQLEDNADELIRKGFTMPEGSHHLVSEGEGEKTRLEGLRCDPGTKLRYRIQQSNPQPGGGRPAGLYDPPSLFG